MWLASSPSQFWRGCGLAAYSGQTKPVGGFYSTVHDVMVVRRLRLWKLRKQKRWLYWANHGPI